MAAGGFKEFVAGEILDEDDINDYLMQGVLVFAGTAARGSAITAPVEGQFAWLNDTDQLTYYSGSAWEPLETGPKQFDFLVIGGGGGGGDDASNGGVGGGGAGGYLCSVTGENSGGGNSAQPKMFLSPADTFTVTIGAGGSGAVPSTNGVNSRFGPIFATGGGRGASQNGGANAALVGGSGGGGAYNPATGAAGLAGQGFAGGNGQTSVGATGGGGGGAGALGVNATSSPLTGGAGGAGVSSSITGSSVPRGGGGGAGAGNAQGAGGTGGGGAGTTGTGTAGTVNTGGGGGGGQTAGGAGGSGVVILKYPDTLTLTVGAGLTSSTSTAGGFKVTSFTAGSDTVTVA